MNGLHAAQRGRSQPQEPPGEKDRPLRGIFSLVRYVIPNAAFVAAAFSPAGFDFCVVLEGRSFD
jgi:hypothetical protein